MCAFVCVDIEKSFVITACVLVCVFVLKIVYVCLYVGRVRLRVRACGF